MPLCPIRVLLIDDDEDDYLLVRHLLSEIPHSEYRLKWEPDAEAAWDRIERDESDVCLLDYRLGGRSGLDVLEDLIGRGIGIPIVLLTGQGDYELDIDAMRAGAADYLSKGELSGAHLERSIRYAIERSRKRDELLRANRVIQALSECNDAVIRIDDEVELLREICRIVVDVGRYRMAWVGYAGDEAGRAITPVASYGHEEGRIEDAEGAWKDARKDDGNDGCPVRASLRTGMPSIVRSIRGGAQVAPWMDEAAKRGYGSIVGLPLFLDGRMLGALTIYASAADAFDPEEVEHLVKIAGNLSFGIGALRVRRAHERAEDLLKKANMELERRVEERTAELSQVNEELRREVEERETAEDALGESRHRLSAIVDSIADGFYALDRGWRFTHVNDAALRYFVKAREEMIGRTIFDVFPSFRGSFFELEYRSAMESGEPVHLEAPSVVNDRTVEIHAYPGPDNLTVLFWDVTEQYRMAEALRESEARFRSIFQQAAVGIEQLTPDGRLLMVNEAISRMLGYSREELERLRQADITCAEDLEAEQGMLARLLAREVTSYSLEKRYIHKDGQRLWVRATSSLVGQGDDSYRVSVIEDITERKRTEEVLRQSLEEKDALLREVHHRVKNNLQIVASLLGLQANRSNSADAASVLLDTRNRVRSMSLLHETLYRSGSLARIDFGTYVRDVCRQLLASFGPTAARVEVESRIVRVGMPLEQAVPCGLIINELVSNALKHGFPGEHAGRIVVELCPSEEQTLVLSVWDDGVGLPAGLDPAATTTLGLRLVSRLAGQLDGRLVMDRSNGVGSAFHVFFPIQWKGISTVGES